MSPVRRRNVVLSQNFLHSRRLVDRLLAQSNIGPDDLVVEIGPGKGLITERLARRCHQVLAVEKDPDLARRLRRRFAGVPNVAIFEVDFLQFPLPATACKVFASIPFNITAAIIARLTSESWTPDDAYLVVQREAAMKILGVPGESLQALLLKPWHEPALIHRFRHSDFVPAPHVEVVMLRLKKRGPPLVNREDARLYRDFVVSVFTAWQPAVRDALARIVRRGALTEMEREVGFSLGRPPSAIQFEEWLDLFGAFHAIADVRAKRAIAGAEERLLVQQSRLEKVHRTRVGSRQ